MKLCQLWLLEKGQVEYNKCLIPNTMASDFNRDHIKWFLSRGNISREQVAGDPKETLDKLMNFYIDLAHDLDFQPTWHEVPLPTKNPTRFSDQFWELFCQESSDPSDAIVDLFIQEASLEKDKSINRAFIGCIQNVHLLPPSFVDSHVHLDPQRSDSWKELLQTYHCGRNTGAKKDTSTNLREWVYQYWNLIRGNICEEIAISSLALSSEFKDYQQIQVGLLVQEKVAGSIGIAPDLMLYDEHSEHIIPIEIKSVPNNTISSVRRETSLARKQLDTCKKILGDLSQQGIIFMLNTSSLSARFCYY